MKRDDRGAQLGGHPGQLVDRLPGLRQRLGGGVGRAGDAGDVRRDLAGPGAASCTDRDISLVVAVCSSTAEAMVSW